MKTIRRLIISVFVLMLLQAATYGQKVAFALYENQLHVVQRVDERAAFIYLNGDEQELMMANTKMVLADVADYLPGFLKLENDSATISDFDEENRGIQDTHVFLHLSKVTPNRDVINGYVSYQWVRADKSTYLISVPLPDMEAGKTYDVRNRFYVPNRFKLVEPEIHFMTMGHELLTSNIATEAPLTPYELVCQKLGVDTLPDGKLRPISMVPNPPINDAEGNPRTGFVHLRMKIDANGFVTYIKPVKYSEWVFAKTVQMTAPFFQFQPEVVDGKPVATAVTVPFKF